MRHFTAYRSMARALTLLFATLLIASVMNQCATSRLSKLKSWHRSGQYQQVVQSKIDCLDKSAECFQIKLIRADSYYRLGEFNQALVYVQDAIKRLSPEIPLEDAMGAYTLRANILFEEVKSLDDFEKKRRLVAHLSSDLEKALQTNAGVADSVKKDQNRRTLTLLQAEVLLMKMDLVPADSMAPAYQKLLTVAGELGRLFPEDGYMAYYSLRAEFKYILPQLKRLLLQNQPVPDELANQLREIERQARALQKKPLYRQGYAGAIDLFLDNVQRFLQQVDAQGN